MTQELKHKCERLSLEEKMELRDYLSASIANSHMGGFHSPLRCSILLGDMAEVMGLDAIGYFSRDPMMVWARAMVAYQMIQEGYSTGEIGRQMMKDHSTIIYLRKKVQNAFDIPRAYQDILAIWNDFQKRIEL